MNFNIIHNELINKYANHILDDIFKELIHSKYINRTFDNIKYSFYPIDMEKMKNEDSDIIVYYKPKNVVQSFSRFYLPWDKDKKVSIINPNVIKQYSNCYIEQYKLLVITVDSIKLFNFDY